MKNTSKVSNLRRHFLKRAGSLTMMLPAALFLGGIRTGHAKDLPQIAESDATAAALKYVHDASQSKERKDTAALCENCLHYTGSAGAEFGPCAIFPKKSVAAKGWCSVWVKKA